MSLKRKHDFQSHATSVAKIYESSKIHDRNSTFIALYCPNPSIPSSTLKSHSDYVSATHRMLAWRKTSSQQTLNPYPQSHSQSHKPVIYESGHDDDGERYGGARLEKVLKDMDVLGTLICARWWGEIMLGPVRFKHIEDCAKEAIGLWQTETTAEANRPAKDVKKVKTGGSVVGDNGHEEVVHAEAETDPEEARKKREQEREECAQLAAEIEQRDGSILVLRELLKEKRTKREQAANGKTEVDSRGDEVATSSVKGKNIKRPPLNYAAMPIAKLRVLEKARDATLTWILGQIEELEKDERKPEPD